MSLNLTRCRLTYSRTILTIYHCHYFSLCWKPLCVIEETHKLKSRYADCFVEENYNSHMRSKNEAHALTRMREEFLQLMKLHFLCSSDSSCCTREMLTHRTRLCAGIWSFCWCFCHSFIHKTRIMSHWERERRVIWYQQIRVVRESREPEKYFVFDDKLSSRGNRHTLYLWLIEWSWIQSVMRALHHGLISRSLTA